MAPVPVLNIPLFKQLSHTDFPKLELNVPISHSWHSVLPLFLEYVPLGHNIQPDDSELEFVDNPYFPLEQLEQYDIPNSELYVPLRHLRHPDLFKPYAVSNVPKLQ
jgi:hypothetical protein